MAGVPFPEAAWRETTGKGSGPPLTVGYAFSCR